MPSTPPASTPTIPNGSTKRNGTISNTISDLVITETDIELAFKFYSSHVKSHTTKRGSFQPSASFQPAKRGIFRTHLHVPQPPTPLVQKVSKDAVVETLSKVFGEGGGTKELMKLLLGQPGGKNKLAVSTKEDVSLDSLKRLLKGRSVPGLKWDEIFNVFKPDGHYGTHVPLTESHLYTVFRALNKHKLPYKNDGKTIIQRYDLDGDGKIGIEDFARMVHKPQLKATSTWLSTKSMRSLRSREGTDTLQKTKSGLRSYQEGQRTGSRLDSREGRPQAASRVPTLPPINA